MTVELDGYYANDIEEVVVAWLTPLLRAGVARELDDPLPFALIHHVAGPENIEKQTADPVVSVHTLCDRSLGYGAAMRIAAQVHRRMTLWGRYHDPITLTSGLEADIDYVNVFEAPVWQVFEDIQILRKVGRYQIGLSYNVPAQ
jgi:hypothetical protein